MNEQDKIETEARDVGVPLEHFAGFREELTRLGYGPRVSGRHLELLADLGAWMARQCLAPREFTSDRISAFLDDRRSRGHRELVSLTGIAPLLDYLTRASTIPPQRFVVPEGPGREVLEHYRRYLETERGLAPRTVERSTKLASRFVASLECDGALDWQRVKARDVTNFLRASIPEPRPIHAPTIVAVLRSFLRFALLEGITTLPLHHAVPPVAGWRMSPLPQGVAPEVLERLLESCDRATARGRRDYAIMTLLSRLGLRAGEVVAMTLEDLDWRVGELTVHGKARRDEKVPLPVDVGAAITDYLHQGRPPATTRAVFLRCYAPRRGLSLPAISGIVYAASDRAGLAPIGAHRLRHSAASMMLARGANLAEVGEVLRHRSASSTAVYAKVDRTRLAPLARPWPGGVA